MITTTKTKPNIKTQDLIKIALFAALTAVLSQISIPLPMTPVPINLATFSVFLAGATLSPKNSALSQTIYLLIGIIGLPVFAGFTSGIGIALGPTGGYIIGYILGAYLISLYLKKINQNHIIAFSIGLLACYSLGTLWFMTSTQTGLIPSLTMCVLPFIPGDIIKIIISAIISKRLKKALN